MYLAFAFGAFVGFFLGTLVAGLCNLAHEADRHIDKLGVNDERAQ